jgi:hypothetical protein
VSPTDAICGATKTACGTASKSILIFRRCEALCQAITASRSPACVNIALPMASPSAQTDRWLVRSWSSTRT